MGKGLRCKRESSLDLRGVDLRGVDLSNVYLMFLNLDGVDMEGAFVDFKHYEMIVKSGALNTDKIIWVDGDNVLVEMG